MRNWPLQSLHQSPAHELKPLFMGRQSQAAPKHVPSAAPYLPQPLHLPVGKLLNAQSLMGHFRFDFSYFFDFQKERLDSCWNREHLQVPDSRANTSGDVVFSPGKGTGSASSCSTSPQRSGNNPSSLGPTFCESCIQHVETGEGPFQKPLVPPVDVLRFRHQGSEDGPGASFCGAVAH